MEYQPATIDTLLLSDSLLAGSRPASSLVFPHPPSIPHPGSLSPRAIAQTTVTELSQLTEWGSSTEYREQQASYHPEYQELEPHHNSPPPPGSPDMASHDILRSALVLNNLDDISYSREEEGQDDSMGR